MQLMHQALRIEPQAAEVKVLAAQLAFHLGHVDEASALIDAALTFAPDNPDAKALRRQIDAVSTTA